MQIDENIVTVYTGYTDLSAVSEAFKNAGYQVVSAEVGMVAQNTVSLDDEKTETFMKFIDNLEDNDDVQNVWHNLE